jgi:cytochrome oxidase assembly protein ShyY1
VLVVALVVGGVCVRLGVWQLSRLHQRNEFVAAVERGLSAAPVPIERVLPPAGEVNADLARYRRVEVSGTYDTSREVVLYGRGSTGDTNGNHVLTPLVMHDGSGIVVDRGWVPIGDNVPPVEAAAPPHGAVELTGILLPSEGGLPGEGGGSRVTETTHVDLAQLASQMPYGLEPLYLLLQSQRPPQVSLPRIAPFRLPSAPPHLSYAIQWFFFAAIAFVGGAVLARREPDGPPPVTNDRRAGGVENAETEAR